MENQFRNYTFFGSLWRYDGPGGWYFVGTPKKLSEEIRKYHQDSEEGWGRLKAQISINKTTWKSSIWYDTKFKCYLVPIKAEIRRKEKIDEDDEVEIELKLEL